MAKKKYTDAAGLTALLARIRQKFVDYALLENLVELQETIAETINGLNDKVDSNTTAIGRKASLTQLSTLQSTVNGHGTQLSDLKSRLKTDLGNLAKADEDLDNSISALETSMRTKHNDEMKRLAFHLGLPEYSVTQMFAWKNASESWGKYKDDTQLEIWPRVDMSAVVNAGSFFAGATALTKVYPMNTSAMTSGASMFMGCTALREVDSVDLSACADMRSMFYQCSALERVGIAGVKAGAIQIRGMFQDCVKLREVTLPLYGHTTNDADVVFYGCSALERVSLGSLVVKKARQMFAHCAKLRIIEGSIDVGLCEDAALMFQGCGNLAQVTVEMIGCPYVETWDFSELKYWGDPDRSEDGGVSLIESMSHVYNPGSDPVTLSFHADTKARLEEAGLIASLTSAGFTIA